MRMRHMTKEQTILFEFIEDLLWYEWDPLGVNGDVLGDNYQSYVPLIFNLAIGDAAAKQIAEKLWSIERETIGVTGDFGKCQRVAHIIVQKKEALLKA